MEYLGKRLSFGQTHLVGDREKLGVAVLRGIRKVVGDVSGRGYIGQSSVI